jgi:hypothetical protein
MSGLTGYLLSDGVTDLSYVFQGIGSSSLIPTSIIATSGTFYPCFASTNASSLGQTIYTDLSGSVSFNKTTNILTVPAISITGPITFATGSYTTDTTLKQLGSVYSTQSSTTSITANTSSIVSLASYTILYTGTYVMNGNLSLVASGTGSQTSIGVWINNDTSIPLVTSPYFASCNICYNAATYTIGSTGNIIQLPITFAINTPATTIKLNYENCIKLLLYNICLD